MAQSTYLMSAFRELGLAMAPKNFLACLSYCARCYCTCCYTTAATANTYLYSLVAIAANLLQLLPLIRIPDQKHLTTQGKQSQHIVLKKTKRAILLNNSCTKHYLNKRQILVEYECYSNMNELRQALRARLGKPTVAMSDAAPKSQSVAPIASRRAVSRAAPISPDPSYRDHGQGGRVSRTQAA